MDLYLCHLFSHSVRQSVGRSVRLFLLLGFVSCDPGLDASWVYDLVDSRLHWKQHHFLVICQLEVVEISEI